MESNTRTLTDRMNSLKNGDGHQAIAIFELL
jgi:hypothetical protein